MNARSDRGVYAGSWDWDRIYRECHRASEVAGRIAPHLAQGPVLFAGFASVAADLGASRDVSFVDWSGDVARRAQADYPAIQTVTSGDILEILAGSDAPNVVLSGRITAFWEDVAMFNRLERAFQAHPRSCLLIDFFDAGSVAEGQETLFGSPPAMGTWHVTAVDRAGPITRAALSVDYDLGGDRFRYDTTRSYFDRDWVLDWAQQTFPARTVEALAPLIPGDPSFGLLLRTRATDTH